MKLAQKNWALLERRNTAEPGRKHFMETKGLLPCSQSLSLVSILSQINPVNTIQTYIPKNHLNTNHHFSQVLLSSLVFYGFCTNNLYEFLFSTIPDNVLFIFSFCTWRLLYMAKSRSNYAFRYAALPIFLPLQFSTVHVFSLVPCS
jgi:hypothetical protein